MGFTIWLCALCLQASLLSHALDCSGTDRGELCVSGQTADEQYNDQKQQRALPLTDGLVMFRRKRQLERRGPTHLSHSSLPGAVSVKGFPKTLIQADRSRRHLVQTTIKKKKPVSRVGSFSLLTHEKSKPLQVTRAKRQLPEVLDPPKKGKSGRSGAFSVLGDPLNQDKRARRSI